MAVITVKVAVGAITDVLDLGFNRLKVYRSTTGINGPYVEVTDSTTRLVLEPGRTLYEYTDENGDPNFYYKSSFFNTVTALESSLSDAQRGEGDGALDVISVADLKTNYLFGLDLTDDNGNEYPDSLFEFYIKSAVSYMELRLDIPLSPKRIVEERHDFYREDYPKYIWLETDVFPILDVEEIKLVLPGERVVQIFPRDWYQIEKEFGQIQLTPGIGSAGTVLLGASGSYIWNLYNHSKSIPGAFRVTYTAGFEPLPFYLRDLVGMLASFGPLNIAGDLLGGAGVASQSLSIDGLSQSIATTSSATNAGYGARLTDYRQQLKEKLPIVEGRLKGRRLTVV